MARQDAAAPSNTKPIALVLILAVLFPSDSISASSPIASGGASKVLVARRFVRQSDGRVTPAPLDSTAFETDSLLASFRPKSETFAMSCLRSNLPPIPEHSEPHLATLFYAYGGVEAAQRQLEEWVEWHSQDPVHFNDLGNVLRVKGESTRAMDCFRHALYLKADFVPAYINLGNVLHIVGQLEEAVQEYQTALLLDAENPLLLYSLGRAYAGLGMDKEAVDVFEKVVGITPDFPLASEHLLKLRAKRRTHQSLPKRRL